MKNNPAPASGLERLLAAVLEYGCWLASAAITGGLAFANSNFVTLGIALFILLPVVRVTVMLGVFLRMRDYRFSVIAALVLTIIFAGYALGIHLGSHFEK